MTNQQTLRDKWKDYCEEVYRNDGGFPPDRDTTATWWLDQLSEIVEEIEKIDTYETPEYYVKQEALAIIKSRITN